MLKVRQVLLVFVLGLTLGMAANAQGVSAGSNDVAGALARMKSGDLHTQKLAFDDLMNQVSSASAAHGGARTVERSQALRMYLTQHPEQADQVKLGLISLLSLENDYFVESKNPPPDPYQEDDIGEHYAELIESVASLDDERTIPALVGAMTTGGMAQRGLLKFGDRALEPVLAQLKNRDALVRAAALRLGISLLEKHADPVSRARIRELIRSSLRDPKPVVRTQAIWMIGCFDDRGDFVPELEEIAKTDPWELPGRADDGGDGDQFFPVRYDARRAIRGIQSNKPCQQ